MLVGVCWRVEIGVWTGENDRSSRWLLKEKTVSNLAPLTDSLAERSVASSASMEKSSGIPFLLRSHTSVTLPIERSQCSLLYLVAWVGFTPSSWYSPGRRETIASLVWAANNGLTPHAFVTVHHILTRVYEETVSRLTTHRSDLESLPCPDTINTEFDAIPDDDWRVDVMSFTASDSFTGFLSHDDGRRLLPFLGFLLITVWLTDRTSSLTKEPPGFGPLLA